ncbi:hypothetical protein MKK55_17980 [Methylobacterium sp. J-059]|uniref:hypothetical protein n=1 Tax=Methylobacterium sp. J-059 TaxID=2836643 RepID=UPI001FB97754|nr:hypothetical protein [Methylobacterium sp. J-059]MCJ2040822.1 hypothetical protein [Methylobacterium sp. J-059]
MPSFRQLLAYAIAAIAYAAQALATTTKLVWRAGKWVAESVSAPLRAAPPAPPGGSAAEAAAALAEASQAPVGVPAGYHHAAAGFDPAKDRTMEQAYLEWGALAQQYAVSQATPDGVEPSLVALDDAAYGWLVSLSAPELLTVANSSPRLIGLHMFGERDLAGLSICPTLKEYEQAKLMKAEAKRFAAAQTAENRQVTADILQDLVDNPTWGPAPAHA